MGGITVMLNQILCPDGQLLGIRTTALGGLLLTLGFLGHSPAESTSMSLPNCVLLLPKNSRTVEFLRAVPRKYSFRLLVCLVVGLQLTKFFLPAFTNVRLPATGTSAVTSHCTDRSLENAVACW